MLLLLLLIMIFCNRHIFCDLRCFNHTLAAALGLVTCSHASPIDHITDWQEAGLTVSATSVALPSQGPSVLISC